MYADTQWSRFQVFVQEAEGMPHQDVGSVHATDPELALLNARDVFARRPVCISMWVVPVEAIYSKTAEELESWDPSYITDPESPQISYYIFSKERSAGTQTLIGSLDAVSPESALASAVKHFSGDKKHYAWWVIPKNRVAQSNIQDRSSFYDPAKDKEFRLSTDFKTHTAMRRIKQSKEEDIKD